MWLWTACRNQIKNNNLSHGIRCLPRDVHANDSACVLVEDGSDDNHFTDNDITYGGDGVFIRGTGGWGSRGNVFERNDASYAHNNCFESQSPGNTYRHNKANHGSHGLFLGGSRDTIVEDNEACYNGELKGLHNAPWTFTYVPGGPQVGATGIFFAGSSADHVRCRRNKCIGNNGGGIAIFGIPSVKASDHIAHWIIENNEIRDNRWGIYMEFADWIDIAGNMLDHNWEGNIIQGGTVTNFSQYADNPKITRSPKAALVGPSAGVEGKEFVLDASGTTDPGGNPLTFRWDLGDGTMLSTPRVAHIFKAPGYYNVGMTVNNGRFSDLGSRGFRVVDDCPELGTEGQAADWDWEEVVPRQNLYWDPKTPNNAPAPPVQVVAKPQSRIEFSNDADCLAGKSSVLVRYWPVANQVRVDLSEIETGRHPAGRQDPAGLLEQADQRRHPLLAGAQSRDNALRIAAEVCHPQAGHGPGQLDARRAGGGGQLDVPQHSPYAAGRRDVATPGRASRHAELPHHRVRPGRLAGGGAIVDRRHGDPLAAGPE